jgi:uncharacterized OsmC-like protein
MSTYTRQQPNVVNGINVDDVNSLIAAVGADPAKRMTKWRVNSVWLGGTHSQARVKSYEFGGEEIARAFAIDVDEPNELGGGNAFANPQEHLLGALNACMIVGYAALCAVQGIKIEKLEIATEGDIDLRGFFALDPAVPPGYENLRYTVTIKGDGTKEQFEKIHEMVMATSPNFYNVSWAVPLKPSLVVEE